MAALRHAHHCCSRTIILGPSLGEHTGISPEQVHYKGRGRLQKRTRDGVMMDWRGRGRALYWDRALSWRKHCRRINHQHQRPYRQLTYMDCR